MAHCMGLFSIELISAPLGLRDVPDNGLSTGLDGDALHPDRLRAVAAVALQGIRKSRHRAGCAIGEAEIPNPDFEALVREPPPAVEVGGCGVRCKDLTQQHRLDGVPRLHGDKSRDRAVHRLFGQGAGSSRFRDRGGGHVGEMLVPCVAVAPADRSEFTDGLRLDDDLSALGPRRLRYAALRSHAAIRSR